MEIFIWIFRYRFAYVVVRTTASSTMPSATPPTRTDPVSHIPTITSSSKLIKSKQSKDDVTKRASVRRTALGRSKMSRSPVKPLICTASSVTSTNSTITTTTANSQNSPTHERVQVEEMLGPVTRSRMCRFCTTEDNGTELNHKRGKRSLSNSRFHDKKNKLSRKNQILQPSSITGTSITRKLRKEASLDSALSEVASHETHDNSSLSDATTKEAVKPRPKKPTVRSASQKVLSSNWRLWNHWNQWKVHLKKIYTTHLIAHAPLNVLAIFSSPWISLNNRKNLITFATIFYAVRQHFDSISIVSSIRIASSIVSTHFTNCGKVFLIFLT